MDDSGDDGGGYGHVVDMSTINVVVAVFGHVNMVPVVVM